MTTEVLVTPRGKVWHGGVETSPGVYKTWCNREITTHGRHRNGGLVALANSKVKGAPQYKWGCSYCNTSKGSYNYSLSHTVEHLADQEPKSGDTILEPGDYKLLEFGGEMTFLVGFIGWGSVDDLYQVSASSVADAIDTFMDDIKRGLFDGHGAHNLDERTVWPDATEHILVYGMAELGQYRRVPQWEKVK